MGQVRHGCATTTHAVRAAIQRSQASTAELSRELGINPKTVAKWRKRQSVEDRKTGPTEPRSAPQPPRRLPRCVQLRPPPQDAQRSHTLRVYLQNLDFRARSIHRQSDPPDAGTEHLRIDFHYGTEFMQKLFCSVPLSHPASISGELA